MEQFSTRKRSELQRLKTGEKIELDVLVKELIKEEKVIKASSSGRDKSLANSAGLAT